MNTWEEYKKKQCIEVKDGELTVFKTKFSPSPYRDDGKWSNGICFDDFEDVWGYQQKKIDKLVTQLKACQYELRYSGNVLGKKFMIPGLIFEVEKHLKELGEEVHG